ncbi:MAG: SpoIIE family protein phosphatase [bacterium]
MALPRESSEGLRRIPFFSKLREEDISKISGIAEVRALSGGDTIFEEGTPGEALYIVKSGRVRILKGSGRDREELGEMRAGDFFGELSLVDGGPHSTTARCEEDTELMVIKRADFDGLVEGDPAILRKMLVSLSSRLMEADLRSIDDLREKNRQLEEAYSELERSKRLLEYSNLELREANQSLEQTLVELVAAQNELVVAERMKKELAIAHDIQMSLLPKGNPSVEGLDIHATAIPAREVGGDYYDFIPLNGGEELCICIGDVSGKGVPAGLVMAVARSILRSLVMSNSSGKRVLIKANALLETNKSEGQYMTLLLMYWDGKRSRMRYTIAGHEYPIVYSSAARRIRRVQNSSFPLGLFDNIGDTLKERKLTLEKGDIVVLYTDGVLDARNGRGEKFGMRRLCEIIKSSSNESAKEISGNIMGEIEDFVGNAEQYDDMTLIVMKKT